MPLYIELQWLCFMYGLSGKLWILMGTLLRYLYITHVQLHVLYIGQETMGR